MTALLALAVLVLLWRALRPAEPEQPTVDAALARLEAAERLAMHERERARRLHDYARKWGRAEPRAVESRRGYVLPFAMGGGR